MGLKKHMHTLEQYVLFSSFVKIVQSRLVLNPYNTAIVRIEE